jgi:hypothetical protein
LLSWCQQQAKQRCPRPQRRRLTTLVHAHHSLCFKINATCSHDAGFCVTVWCARWLACLGLEALLTVWCARWLACLGLEALLTVWCARWLACLGLEALCDGVVRALACVLRSRSLVDAKSAACSIVSRARTKVKLPMATTDGADGTQSCTCVDG